MTATITFMQLVVIAHNIRSTHNIGAILRSCDAFGVKTVYCSGYTPYPKQANDHRLPHIASKLTAQISKTALGAEKTVNCQPVDNIKSLIDDLKQKKYMIVGLEQDERSQPLKNFQTPPKMGLLIGEEVSGIDPILRSYCDTFVEIAMRGQKESLNVAVATGIALYQLTS